MEEISIAGAVIYYDECFLPTEDATQVFEILLQKCPWERSIAFFGRPVPREEAYYGDPDAHYTYSRRRYDPLPWIPELLSLKRRVERATPAEAYRGSPPVGYNAVLCNLYRNGNDSMGLHADDEPEMGPVIASVSLGAERLFRLKRRGGGVVFARPLLHGSLLIMAGDTQKNFRHEVPKEPAVTQPRINLTFRRIRHS
jgi:alkylated DNA repair dioxygenase AlkB